MTLPGERQAIARAVRAMKAVEEPPPGECAADELPPEEGLLRLDQWFTAPRLTLSDIAVNREGRWVFISFRFRKAPWAGYTVKVKTAWVRILIGRLRLALGE